MFDKLFNKVEDALNEIVKKWKAIKVGDFNKYLRADIVKYIGPGGNSNSGPVYDNKGVRHLPKSEGEAILKNIKKIETAPNQTVYFTTSQNPNIFHPSGKNRLYVIQGDSEVEFNVEKGDKTGFILKRGKILEDADFTTAANLDEVMDVYSQIMDLYGNMISKNVETMRGNFKTNDTLADGVIHTYASFAGGFGVLSGVAPIYMMPFEFGYTFVQNNTHSQIAYALSCVYKKKPKSLDQFKTDLYVLFAEEDVEATLCAVVNATGGGAIGAGRDELISKLASESVLTFIGSTKFVSAVRSKLPDLITKRITAKNIAKRVPVITVLYGAIGNVKDAENFGKEAKKYYSKYCNRGSAGQNVPVPELTSAIVKVNVSPSAVTVKRGSTQRFTADVVGVGPTKAVKWSLMGANAGSKIDSNGVLTVGPNSSLGSGLIVKAASAADPSKYGTATVTVPAPAPTVTKVTVSPSSAALKRGSTQRFTASVAGDNNPPKTVNWSLAGNNGGTSISADGVLTVGPNQSPSPITVKATSTADSSKYGTAGATVSAPTPAPAPPKPPTVTGVSINPFSATVNRGSTKQFTASVMGSNNPDKTVKWSLSGDNGGTKIDSSGLLTVGASQSGNITVKATSTADSSKSKTSVVTVPKPATPAPPKPPATPTVTGVSINPFSATVNRGSTKQFSASVMGSNNPEKTVKWSLSGAVQDSTISDSGLLKIGEKQGAGAITVKATSTVDPSKSATAAVTVPMPTTVTGVIISPLSASVNRGSTKQFSATVAGTKDVPKTVKWSVSGAGSGTSINDKGLLTVGANQTPATLTVKATSTADSSKSGTASVTVPGAATPTVTKVSVSPSPITVNKGSTKQFTAAVEGTNSPAKTVKWSVSGAGAGTSINDKGLLTVGANQSSGTLTVKATSTADGSKSGTASVTVPAAATPTPTKPTVTKVSVSPSPVTVKQGSTKQFSATVTGTNSPAKTVKWSLTGAGSGTSINDKGLLTVGANQSSCTLTVKAASTADSSKSGTAAVTVPAPPAPTPPKPAPTPSNKIPYPCPTSSVKDGVKGDSVKWVQWSLNKIMNSGLTVDGSCGSKTVEAIKKFQKNHSLTVDGSFGSESRKKMISLLSAKGWS